MNVKIIKTNHDLDFLNARLDEVRMSSHERLRAKASLARSEAVAEAVVEIVNLVKRLLKALVVRPYRYLATLVG